MSKEIIDRLNTYIVESNNTPRSFALKAQIDPSNLIKMLNDKQSISDKTLQKIEKNIGLSKSWLLTGEGEMLVVNNENLEQYNDSKIEVIPLLPVEAIAGGLQMWSQGVELKDCKKIVSPIPGADFAIHVSGDSMEPEIHNGTYIYIKRINDRAFIPWGNTMVVDTENGVVVKKLFPIEGDDECILAKSVNPAYPPFKIPTDSIYGIYRVLGGSFVVSTL